LLNLRLCGLNLRLCGPFGWWRSTGILPVRDRQDACLTPLGCWRSIDLPGGVARASSLCGPSGLLA